MSEDTPIKEPDTPKRSLIKKLCEVMAVVERIPKRGRNSFHNYNYVTEADLADAIRGELASRHVFIFPNVKDCVRSAHEVETQRGIRKTQLTEVNIEWTFVDGESGEERTINVAGVGEDNVDKGFYKAFTGSEKYMLMKSFLVPTGDDPEAESKTDSYDAKQKASQVAAAKLRKAANGQEGVTLVPWKDNLLAIQGNGLTILKAAISDVDRAKINPKFDKVSNVWTLPILEGHTFASLCEHYSVECKWDE